MIEIRIYWKKSTPEKMGDRYCIGLFQFPDEKTQAVIEKLNALSENPMDSKKVVESWNLGPQSPSKEGS